MKKTASREGGGDACKFQCTEEEAGEDYSLLPLFCAHLINTI